MRVIACEDLSLAGLKSVVCHVYFLTLLRFHALLRPRLQPNWPQIGPDFRLYLPPVDARSLENLLIEPNSSIPNASDNKQGLAIRRLGEAQ